MYKAIVLNGEHRGVYNMQTLLRRIRFPKGSIAITVDYGKPLPDEQNDIVEYVVIYAIDAGTQKIMFYIQENTEVPIHVLAKAIMENAKGVVITDKTHALVQAKTYSGCIRCKEIESNGDRIIIKKPSYLHGPDAHNVFVKEGKFMAVETHYPDGTYKTKFYAHEDDVEEILEAFIQERLNGREIAE